MDKDEIARLVQVYQEILNTVTKTNQLIRELDIILYHTQPKKGDYHAK